MNLYTKTLLNTLLSSIYLCSSYSSPASAKDATSPLNPSSSTLEAKIQEQEGIATSLSPQYHFNQKDLERYQKWKQQAISYSRKTGQVVLIINKSKFELEVYKKGELNQTFPIELGKNPYDDKKYQGDQTTPEGFYKITRVKDVHDTSFYRAAELNYPNEQDRIEFKKLKKEGIIPKSATIGGAINIHGRGSGISPLQGGSNWTNGCTALSDEEMDRLFPYLQQGTRVLIIKYDNRTILDIPPDKKTIIKQLKYLTKSIDNSIYK